MKKTQNRHLYLQHSFKRIFLASTMSMLVQYLVLISDKVIAGQLIGEDAITAVIFLEPFISIIVFIGYLISDGSDMLVTLHRSRGDSEKANEFFSQAVLMSIGFGLLVSVIYFVFSDQLLAAVCTNSAISALGNDYFRFLMFTPLPRILAMTLYSIALYQGGDLYCNIYSTIVVFANIGLSVVLCMFMGIGGIALATLISETIAMIPLIRFFFVEKKTGIKFVPRLKTENIRELFAISFSKSSIYLFLPVFELVMNSYISWQYGSAKVLVFGLVMNVVILYSAVYEGITNFLDANMNVYRGEDNYAGIFGLVNFCNKVCLAEGAVVTVLLTIFAEPIVRAFGVLEPAIMREGTFALRIIALCAIPFCFADIYRNYYSDIGHTKLCLMINLLKYLPLPIVFVMLIKNIDYPFAIWIALALGFLASQCLAMLIIKIYYNESPFPCLIDTSSMERQRIWDRRMEHNAFMPIAEEMSGCLDGAGVDGAVTSMIIKSLDKAQQNIMSAYEQPEKLVTQYFLDFTKGVRVILRHTGDPTETESEMQGEGKVEYEGLEYDKSLIQSDVRMMLSINNINVKEGDVIKMSRSRLGRKFIASFLVLGILVAMAVAGIGYFSFMHYIQNQYNTAAYQIAETAKIFFEGDELDYYVKVAKDSESTEKAYETMTADGTLRRYNEISEQLEKLRSSMNVIDIYIADLDSEILAQYNGSIEGWEPFCFAFDCCADKAEIYPIAVCGPFAPEYIDVANKAIISGEKSDTMLIAELDYGKQITAILPVKSNDKTIIIGVEVAVATLEEALGDYTSSSIMITLFVVVAFISAAMIYLYRKVITPIKIVTHEVKQYADENKRFSDKIAAIHTGDELEDLCQSVLKLEEQNQSTNQSN